jgi:hypothetical protein
MINFKLIATKLGNGLKYITSVNEIDRTARAIFDFEVSEHPLGSITSVRAQSIYDWVMTLAEQPIDEERKLFLLQNFIYALTSEDNPLRSLIEQAPKLSKAPRADVKLNGENVCFVLMPFEERFDKYYRSILVPAISDAGLRPLRADEIFGVRPVITDIWESIKSATVIVAELTGRNPNVLYELGLCHGSGKPAIIITQSIEDVPFDLKHRRCIVYDTKDPEWASELKESVAKTIRAFLRTAANRRNKEAKKGPKQT